MTARHPVPVAAETAFVAALALGSLATPAPSQAARGVVAMRQAVRDAGCDRLVLLVASHPDDQYLYPAAMLRLGRGWRVAVALLTRGEGGQNIAGPETGDALGRLRTIETEECAGSLDIGIHYLNRPDGGYCRSAEEALDLWGRVGTTEDLARLVRELQPDVVMTTHNPDEEHGHDQALLRILPDAVAQAASPRHRLDGLPPYAVCGLFRGAVAGESIDWRLDGDVVEPVHGDTYRRLAYAALGAHRSQRPFRPLDELYAPTLELHSLPVDGVETATPQQLEAGDLFAALRRRDLPAPDVDALERGISELGGLVARPDELVAHGLDLRSRVLRLLAAVTEPPLRRRLERRREALDRVVVHGAGVALVAVVPGRAAAVPGEELDAVISVHNGSVRPVDSMAVRAVRGCTFEPRQRSERLPPESSASFPLAAVVTADAKDTYPQPTTVPAVVVACELGIGGQTVVWPLTIADAVLPPVRIEFTGPALLLPRQRQAATVAVRVRNESGRPLVGRMQIRAPVGFRVEPDSIELDVPPRSLRIVTLQVMVPEQLRPAVYWLRAHFAGSVAELPVHFVDASVPGGLRVGLVPGVDDAARRMVEDLGAELHILDGDDIATFPLRELDTVVIDIRALRIQESVKACFDRLLAFAQGGGRVLVFYHKDVEFDPELAGFRGAPFPLHIGKGRVTQEDAPVRLLRPDHPLLHYPNRLLARDWDGWVQERGLYFPERYDDRYEELVAMADAGHDELRSGLLYARTGEGDYVYCALALYRQLKIAHPGACRLFANLISPPRTR